MTSRRDKVKQGMDSVVSEPWVTLDTRLFGEDVVVLAFEVGHYFLESRN